MANPLFIKIEFPSADNKKSAVAGDKTGSTGKNQSSSDESSGNGATFASFKEYAIVNILKQVLGSDYQVPPLPV